MHFLSSSLLIFATFASSQLVPGGNQRLLTIGQDVDSINLYNQQFGLTPGGVVGYVGIDLNGLDVSSDYGAGRNNLRELSATYPQSALVLGIALGQELGNINNGGRDGEIGAIIDRAFEWNQPIYLRWGYEVDGPWNALDPDQFIQSWIRVWNIIDARNAHQYVPMVWQCATWCGGSYQNRPCQDWYPGNQYIDWIGISYFAPQDCNWDRVNGIGSFAQQQNKPLFINEATPQRYDLRRLTYSANPSANDAQPRTAQQIWQEWFVPFFNYINTYNIKAITYINAAWDEQSRWGPPYAEGYWGISGVQENDYIRQQWNAQINSTTWLNASPDLLSQIGFPGAKLNIADIKIPLLRGGKY